MFDNMTERETREALDALADFLKARVDQARRGELSAKSVTEIRIEARAQAEQ